MSSQGITGLAVIVGFLFINDFNADQQSALGEWFNVVGDILSCNSAFIALNQGQDDNQDQVLNDDSSIKDIDLLKEAIKKIQKKLEKMGE